ncbi:MAG: uroporphyrinogen decarboxylase family protein [Promethearchaeota archaeon]
MDAKERVLKEINHEEPDKIPSFEASIDNLSIYRHYGAKYIFQGAGKGLKMMYYLCWGSNKLLTKILVNMSKKKSAIRRGIKPVIELYAKIGIDLCVVPLCLYPIRYFKTGYIDEFARKFEFKKNPADNMDISYYMGGTLKDFEDYEAFPPLDPDNPTREKAYRIAKDFEKKYNDRIYIAPSIFGMMEPTWEAFGLENFSRLLAKPKQVKKIFDDRGQFAVDLVKRVIEWGEDGAILVYDDYGYKAGLFMSPRNYRKYVFPWLKRICDEAHKGGLKVMLHSCGDDYLIFKDIIDAGVDAIHPIEPTTANPDYDIFKLNEQYGDKICFIGNVSPQDLSDKNPNYIKEYTTKLIKNIAPGGGFILSSGHSINPAVKLENFLAMREILEKYGAYPIRIN